MIPSSFLNQNNEMPVRILPFIGDGIIHNHVKGGHAVRGYDQELVFHFINISDFPRFSKARSLKLLSFITVECIQCLPSSVYSHPEPMTNRRVGC